MTRPNNSHRSLSTAFRVRAGSRPNRSAMRSFRHRRANAFSLTEMVVVVVIIMILSIASLGAMEAQWRNEQTYAVANELAGWIANVQRAAMRGLRCDVNISPNANLVSNGDVLATASQDTGTTLPTSCQAYATLSLESVPAPRRFSVTPNNLAFSFTPRGTIVNSGSDPIVISVSNEAGGSRCIRIDGLLAIIRVGYLNGTSCDT